MTEKRRLGKGLGALIPDAVKEEADVGEVMLDQVKANPYQPRRDFDDGSLEELANSIREHGVIQAVVVTPDEQGTGYYLVAGERRCRAAQIVGMKKIPAVIKQVDKRTMLELALVENLQREDLNPVEEARAFQLLMQEFSYTQEGLAKVLGKSRPAIANSIRLLGLAETVLDMLTKGQISAGQARPLLAVSEPLEQEELARRIVSEGLTARSVEKTVQGGQTARKKSTKTAEAGHDPVQAELEQQMQRSLGTKVRIRPGKEGGMIELYYFGEEDLERLVSKLVPQGL